MRLLIGELPFNFRRHARSKRLRRDFLPLQHDGSRGDQAPLVDHAVGEERRFHPHEHSIAHRGAMNQSHMPDGDIVTERARSITIDVEDAVVLNICAFTNPNRVDVAT